MIYGQATLAAALRQLITDIPQNVQIFAWDTPIKNSGQPDTEYVYQQMRNELNRFTTPQIIVILSQIPVGSCKKFEQEYPLHKFVVSPENVRAKYAYDDFKTQSRIVLGSRHDDAIYVIKKLFHPFTSEFICTTPETAEMVKHGLNGFLALSICYAHELADLAKKHDADPFKLAEALMADTRIGKKAYLKPVGGLGSHLTREIFNLNELGGGDICKVMKKIVHDNKIP